MDPLLTTEHWDKIGHVLIGLFFVYCLASDPEFLIMFITIGFLPFVFWLSRKNNQE